MIVCARCGAQNQPSISSAFLVARRCRLRPQSQPHPTVPLPDITRLLLVAHLAHRLDTRLLPPQHSWLGCATTALRSSSAGARARAGHGPPAAPRWMGTSTWSSATRPRQQVEALARRQQVEVFFWPASSRRRLRSAASRRRLRSAASRRRLQSATSRRRFRACRAPTWRPRRWFRSDGSRRGHRVGAPEGLNPYGATMSPYGAEQPPSPILPRRAPRRSSPRARLTAFHRMACAPPRAVGYAPPPAGGYAPPPAGGYAPPPGGTPAAPPPLGGHARLAPGARTRSLGVRCHVPRRPPPTNSRQPAAELTFGSGGCHSPVAPAVRPSSGPHAPVSGQARDPELVRSQRPTGDRRLLGQLRGQRRRHVLAALPGPEHGRSQGCRARSGGRIDRRPPRRGAP